MKNSERICEFIVENKIMTKRALNSYIAKFDGALPLKTLGQWSKLGYKVPKGTKAIGRTQLWQNANGHYYLKDTNLFSEEQVELKKPVKTENIAPVGANEKKAKELVKSAEITVGKKDSNAEMINMLKEQIATMAKMLDALTK